MQSRAESRLFVENRCDEMTYAVVIPTTAEVIGGDLPAQNQALSKLDSAMILRYPARYARWLALDNPTVRFSVAARLVTNQTSRDGDAQLRVFEDRF